MLKPLNKNIVLKKEEVENKTASGIILTTETKSLPTVGEVVAVGPQCENDLKEN
jgi:chaperonin GroES